MKITRKVSICLAILLFLTFIYSINSFASSFSISSSKSSVTTGDSFTVTISASDATRKN